MKKSILILGCFILAHYAFCQSDVAGIFGHQRTAGRYCGWSPTVPGSIAGSFELKNEFPNQPINFFAGGATAAFQRMTILGTTGFVGIGLVSPVQRLHVSGDINLETSILSRTVTNDGYRINNITVLQIKQADNLFVGWHAGENWIATGIAQNTFVGNYAGFSNTNGSHNTFLGFSAGRSNTRANNNTFIGYQAGLANGSVPTAERNTFIGNGSGYQNTSGRSNTFIGDLSGAGNISGNFNTYLGAYTAENLPGSIQANYNTFAGHDAGHDITTGDGNAVLGAQAAEHITTGEGNFIGGLSAANNIGSGKNNVYIGLESGLSNANVDNNVFMGYQTGRNHTGSTLCTFIGYRAGFDNTLNSYTYVNAAGIGANAVPTATNKMILGDNKVFVGIGLSNDQSAALGPQNCLEINAHLLGSAVPAPNKSGLRFRQLTSASPAGPAASKVLTVDVNGDVILVDANSSSGTVTGAHNGTSMSTINPDFVAFGNDVGSSTAQLLNDREIPMNGNNIVFTGSGIIGKNNIGIGTTLPAAKLDIRNGDEQTSLNVLTDVPASGDVYGVYSQVRGSTSQNIGVNGEGVGAAALNNYGVRGVASDATAINYGGFFGALTAAPNSYGVYSYAASTGTTNYGVFSNATNAANNYAIYGVSGTGANDWAGFFQGNVYISGTYGPSDINLKENIDTISDALHIIHELNPKSFNFKTSAYPNMGLSDKRQYGLIAQEVETILPELVGDAIKPEEIDSSGNVVSPAVSFKTLNYQAFTAILIKGMQEQQEQLSVKDSLIAILKQNDSLQDYRMTLLENAVNVCCNAGHSMQQNNNSSNSVSSINVDLKDKQVVILEQNNPNPFNEQTTISYFLPDNVSKAEMLFYNAQGRLIQSVELKEKGKGQLNVFASDLSNGIYTYTLVVDGKIMETKKMLRQ